jgi:methyl-accepting chemotaxis protein PixJ
MIGGSLLVGKFNQTLNPKPDPAIAQPQANDDRWTNLLLLLCLGGINSGAALWLLTRRLSNSLGEIGHRLEEAAQGNLETYLDVKSTAELQQVAEHFNQLVANCNHTIKQQRITADGNRLFGKIALAAREYLDPIEVYNLGVIGIKQILQVDRVLVYRFEADWSGTIIAEAVAPEYKSALFERVTDTYFTESPAGVEHYRQGGKLVVNDVAQASLTPCHQDIYVDLQVRATVVVPIVVKEKLVGLLCVQQCSKSRQWDGGEVDFCLQAAQRVGLAVEQIEMWEEQSNTLRRAQMLSHTLQLQHSEEFGEVMTEILHDIRQEFNLDRAIILSINEQWEGEIIAEVLKTGNPSMLGQEIDAHPDIEAFRSGGYERGQVTVIEDIYRGDLNHHQIELMEALQVRARILAPILVEDQLFGLLIGHMCNHPRPWEPGEIDRFASVAQQTGVALDRSKMIERREANLQRAKLLSDVSLKLRQSFKETEILDNALPEIRQAFGLDRAIVLAFDQTWQGKIIAEATAIPELSIGGEVITESWFQSSQGAGFDRGKTIAMADVAQANLSECHRQLLERLQVRANIVVPILTGNKLFGLLIGHMCHDPRRWQTTEIDLLAQIATQIGLALNQAQLLAQREADARRASILSNFTLQLRQSLDRDRILNTAVELVRQSLDLDRAIVFGLDRDFNGKIIAESVISDRLSILEEEIYDTCIQDAGYQQGRTNAIPDVYQAGLTDCHLKMLERLQVRANLIVPITIDSQLFGLLIGHQCHQPRSWQPEEISLLNQLATQLALALNQSQLVEQLAIASQQQAELAAQQQAAKEALQKHAWDLLMQVDLISKGDLTIRARVTDDEIGTIADSYNATVESLSQLVTEVQTVSHQVVNTTYENGQSVADLSTEALQQVEEVRAAHQRLQEMSQSIQMVVHHALAAESAILEAAQIVEAGDVAMNRTVEGMLSIRHTVAETAKKVKRLGESSQKISRVVNLIGSFAAQTNLLALNASIEAARAGEEGRGFAVVAEEVRALARQSAEATGEIEKLVASIQMETNEVVTAMEVGTEQVVAGTKLVDETRSRLNQITATSNRIAELVQTIAEAALAQSEQSAQVTHSIERVSLISTTTSERADRVRSSFQELLELSQELQTHIGQFKIG